MSRKKVLNLCMDAYIYILHIKQKPLMSRMIIIITITLNSFKLIYKYERH